MNANLKDRCRARPVMASQDCGNLNSKSRHELKPDWNKMSSVPCLTMRSVPTWDCAQLDKGFSEVRKTRETFGPPLDQTSFYLSFVKARHMCLWYKNTIDTWIHSFSTGDFGHSLWVHSNIDVLKNLVRSDNLSLLCGRLTAFAVSGLMEKYLKWATATLWASSLLQTELPPSPDFLPDGFSYHLFPSTDNCWKELVSESIKRKVALRRWFVAFCKDIYFTKNASLPVDQSFIQENLDKHKKILVSDSPSDPLSNSLYGAMRRAIKLSCNEIFGENQQEDFDLSIDEIFENQLASFNGQTVNIRDYDRMWTAHVKRVKRYNKERSCPSRVPSCGASFSSNRKLGGALYDIIDSDDLRLPEPSDGYLVGYTRFKGDLRVELRSPHDPAVYCESEISSYRRALCGEAVEATVVPLLEAFKVRTITKGDADQYHLARRWQSVIHARMRKHPACALIGRPCNSSFLSNRFGNNSDMTDFPEGFFVSGDYESATDLLHPALSEYAQECISHALKIPVEDQMVLNRCLTQHRLHYEKNDSGYQQTWGQLMGSPTSFPVLCLINLAATKLAEEAYEAEVREGRPVTYRELAKDPQWRVSLRDSSLMVNGDDILFWGRSPRHYEIWKQITKGCGLKFSLGKNYTHPSVAIINSEMYFLNHLRSSKSRSKADPRPSLLFYKVPALNSRLLSLNERASSGDSLSEEAAKYAMPSDQLNLLIEIAGYKNCLPITKEQTRDQAVAKFRSTMRQSLPHYFEEYMRLRDTIDGRVTILLQQLKGDQVELKRKGMMEFALSTFSAQARLRLGNFQSLLGVDQQTPYYLPTQFGGLGLPRPISEIVSVRDALEVISIRGFFQGDLEGRSRFISGLRPPKANPDFLKNRQTEINFHRAVHETGSHYTVFDDESTTELSPWLSKDDIWDRELLGGFLLDDNVVVHSDDSLEAFLRFRQSSLQRSKKVVKVLGSRMRAELERLVDLGHVRLDNNGNRRTLDGRWTDKGLRDFIFLTEKSSWKRILEVPIYPKKD
nr:MAG: putative RNA-dependent RNA polymerase [Narnaviridae sp.]